MKRIFFLIPIFCGWLFFTFPVDAKIVKYMDEQGKFHYVNTDFQSVPSEYQDQVRDQLPTEATEEPGQDEQTTSQPGNAESSEDSTQTQETKSKDDNQQTILVEVFVSNPCPNCVLLETILRKYEVVYSRYDVNTTPYGNQKYKETGWTPPFVRLHPLERSNLERADVQDEWLNDMDPQNYDSIVTQKIEEYEALYNASPSSSGQTKEEN